MQVKPRKLLVGWIWGFVVVLAGLICPIGPAFSQEGNSPEAPPIPPGYETQDEVLAAIKAGKVPIVNLALPVPDSVTEEKGVEYGKVGDRSLQLDLYSPKSIDKPVPGLICIHGGGWSGGNRSDYRFYAIRLAEKGYVAATISYRLSGEAPYPAAASDAKCAVRWMRANAGNLHVDPEEIGVIGASAGGHLAMMVGYSSDIPELEGDGGHAEASSGVQAVVNFYGPCDLTTDFAKKQDVVKKFMGGKTYEEAPDLYKQASPLFHLDEEDPPTLVFHGTIDEIVPISQSDRLVEKLNELEIQCVYERFEGWPHTMDLAQAVNDRCFCSMERFLAENLPLPE